MKLESLDRMQLERAKFDKRRGCQNTANGNITETEKITIYIGMGTSREEKKTT